MRALWPLQPFGIDLRADVATQAKVRSPTTKALTVCHIRDFLPLYVELIVGAFVNIQGTSNVRHAKMAKPPVSDLALRTRFYDDP